MKIIYPLIGGVTIVMTAGASAGPLPDDFWLLGNYTQNKPCKGEFLDAKPDGNRINTHVECQFPAGPLMGDITFTMKPNNTIDFVDRDKTYTATLYRCPK